MKFYPLLFLVMASGFPAPANATPVENLEPAPVETFSWQEEPPKQVPEENIPVKLDSPRNVASAGGQGEAVSLWDFFSRFFELAAPGDPNHPDKLRLTLNGTIGYDDNVFTTQTDRIASATSGLNGTLSYSFGSERLTISTSLTLGVTYYDNRPGDPTDYNGNYTLTANYRVNRRLEISTNISFAYLSQPSPTVIGGISRFSGDYLVSNVGFATSYSLQPRLALRLEYGFNSVQYAEESQNQSLGFAQETYVIGLDYLLTPRWTISAQYQYAPLYYEAENQDSTGHILSFGFSTSISPKFRWVLQAGAEERILNNVEIDGSPSQYIGPFLETNIQYDFAPGSAVVGSLRYGTEPSGSAGISVRQTLRGSLSFSYAFSGRLSADAGVSFEHDSYDQPGDINDYTLSFYSATIGVKYLFNPSMAATLNYQYYSVQSDIEANEYTRGISTVGLQVIF